jgi:hypothetical protein
MLNTIDINATIVTIMTGMAIGMVVTIEVQDKIRSARMARKMHDLRVAKARKREISLLVSRGYTEDFARWSAATTCTRETVK